MLLGNLCRLFLQTEMNAIDSVSTTVSYSCSTTSTWQISTYYATILGHDFFTWLLDDCATISLHVYEISIYKSYS